MIWGLFCLLNARKTSQLLIETIPLEYATLAE
jgi:hypothetical protein